MAEYDFGGSFLRGMTGTADMLNANKRVQIMEEEAGREKTKFDQDQHDRTMKRGIAGWYGRTLGPDGQPDLNLMNEGVLSTPGFKEAWQELKPGTQYRSLEQDPEDPDGVVIHFTNQNGTPDFMTDDKDEVVRMPKKQVGAHMMGIMWQYHPELAKYVTEELAGQVTEDKLAEFYGTQDTANQPQPVAGQPAQAAAPRAPGLGAAAVTGAPGPQPAAPTAPPAAPGPPAAAAPAVQGDPTEPQWDTPTEVARSVGAGLKTAAGQSVDSMRRMGEFFVGPYLDQRIGGDPSGKNPYAGTAREALVGGGEAVARGAKGLYDSAVDWTSRNVVEPVAKAWNDIPEFARGGGAPAAKPAAKPSTMPAKTPAKQVVQAAQQQERSAPAPRADVPVQQRTVPALVQQNMASLNPTTVPPKHTKAEVSAYARNIAHLQRKGMLTAESAQNAMDRFFGKTTKVVPAGGYLFGFNADNQMVSSMEIPMTEKDRLDNMYKAQTVQAAFMAARAKVMKAQGEDDRGRFKDRMAVNDMIMSSYDSKHKNQGLEAVSRLDAAFQNLGLDERSPGVLALAHSAETARRAFVENGWFRKESDYNDLTPFILAGSIPTGDTDDPMGAANEMVFSPIHAAVEKTGAKLNENALVGSIVNAAGYGIPADWAAATLAGYVQSNPQAFANADPKRIGAALANEFKRQKGQ